MTGPKLPDGIPVDNTTNAALPASGEGAYDAPQMAVPDYAKEKSRAAVPGSAARQGVKFAAPFADDERAAPSSLPRQVKKLTMFLGLAAVLAALGIIAVAMSGDGLPLCSTQPDWNQYNCRAG